MWRVREWLLVFSLRRWLYSWRRSRHVSGGPPVALAPLLPFYGSMDLDAERALGTHLPACLAAPLDPLPGWGTVASGWREQVADGLSPEALDDALMTSTNDSGPVGSSLAPPGPDPMWEYRADHPGSLPERAFLPTRLADTADITDARLLADVQADMRTREAGCMAYLASFGAACERVRLDLRASLA